MNSCLNLLGMAILTALQALTLPSAPAAGHAVSPPSTSFPSDTSIQQASHGMALARMGRSGLRSLLSATGSLGDLRNRAGSYRMAVQLERARTGQLQGLIDALDGVLSEPALSTERRAALEDAREAARAELERVPRYEASYETFTAQAEALRPFGFLGDRPLFLLVRGRGHARGGGDEGLTVFYEAVSVGPVLAAGPWISSTGITLGRTDVDIAPFDGRSATTSVSASLDVGRILGESWGITAQLSHAWSHGVSTIFRPGPDGATEVRSAGWSRTASAKTEVKGHWMLARPGDMPLTLRPRVGAFLTTSHTPRTANSLGEVGAGPFGEEETLAALRTGVSLDLAAGAWSPSLYLGWERELTQELSVLVDDRNAVLGVLGAGWSWSRGRRLVADYTYIRGTAGLRRVSELTLVLILDG